MSQILLRVCNFNKVSKFLKKFYFPKLKKNVSFLFMGEKSKEELIILILSEYNLFQIKSCEEESQNFSLEICILFNC